MWYIDCFYLLAFLSDEKCRFEHNDQLLSRGLDDEKCTYATPERYFPKYLSAMWKVF